MTEPRMVSTHDTELELHELVEIFPAMDAEQFDKFQADIIANGIAQPVELFNGKIIDGRHRWRAAKDLHMQCPVVDWDGDESHLAEYVVSKNLHRRHMTPSQLAMVATRLNHYSTQIQHGRVFAGPDKAGQGQGRAAVLVSKAVGASPAYVKRAAAVHAADPKLADDVLAGKTSLPAAHRQVQVARETKPVPAPEPTVTVKDETGRVFTDPDRAARYTHAIGLVEQAIRAVAAAATACRTVAGDENAGQFVHRQSLDAAIANLRNAIVDAKPHASCPYCVVGCEACRGNGWVPKHIYTSAPKELKQ